MAFECENWGDSRGKASQSLFESLRRRRPAGSATAGDLPSSPSAVGADVVVNSSRKRTLEADNHGAEKKLKVHESASAPATALAPMSTNTAMLPQRRYRGWDENLCRQATQQRPSETSRQQPTTQALHRTSNSSIVVDLTGSDDDDIQQVPGLTAGGVQTTLPFGQPLQQDRLPAYDAYSNTYTLGYVPRFDTSAMIIPAAPIAPMYAPAPASGPGSFMSTPYPASQMVSVTTLSTPRSSSPPHGKWHAVRVGWFPGIYHSKTEANKQTKNYPLREQEVFESEAEAKRWLSGISTRVKTDAATRPKTLGTINQAAFMAFVGRAWSKPNQLPGVDNKELVQKLRALLKEACEDERHDVDWNLQPLPQILVSQEKEAAKNTGRRYKMLGLWSGALKSKKPTPGVTSAKPSSTGRTEQRQSVNKTSFPPSSPPVVVEIKPASTQSRQPAPSYAPSTEAAKPKWLLGSENGTCICKKAVTSSDSFVFCANEHCTTRCFHRACAGFKTRPPSVGWRCYECRPKPPPSTLPPSSSQLPPSSSQLRSSPPLMDSIPQSAPMPQVRYEPEPPLHSEQATIVDAIVGGANVFYTGSAGTGKSTVLKSFVQKLKAQGKHVSIIAPSGIAALNVGGHTTYAYAGWYPDLFKLNLNDFLQKAWGKKVRKRLCATDVLVIDEISMVERDVLVRLDLMMRETRQGYRPEKGQKQMSRHGKSFPFGGAQVVVTGDFCQLPPVKPFKFCMWCGGDEIPGHNLQDARPLTCRRCKRVYKDEDKWAFCSDAWRACKFTYFELRHIHRQSDKRFIDILQRCRYGQPLTPEDRELLLAPKPDPVGAVKLLPRRDEVNNENLRNFNALASTPRTYNCHDVFIWKNKDEPELQYKSEPKYPNLPDGPLKALQDHRFEEQIRLKVGMLVILLVNLDFDTGLVNGSQGRIIGFEKHSAAKVFPPKAPSSPRKIVRRGSDAAFDEAQKSARELMMEEQVQQFISRNAVTQWPVVEFHNGHVQPIYASCQLSELGSEQPFSVLGRTQMPLLAAWAITVHKSQGMTLNRVIVDLHNSFEREMVYVALSRARSLEGLKVLRLARSLDKGGVNEQVQAFLKTNGLGGCRT